MSRKAPLRELVGAILASKRSRYEDLIAAGFNEEVLAERLKRQHRLICAAINAGRLEDLKILEEIGNAIGIMPGTTICGLADGAGWPVKTAIRKFRSEFEDYIRSGQRSEQPVLAGAH